MTLHAIEPGPQTLHGIFSRDLPPILIIEPGDTVVFRTLDADWNLAPRRSTRFIERPPQFTPRPAGQEDGHPLCGPVAIRGAQPGMTLGIRIGELRPGRWGYTAVGGWPHPINDRLQVTEEGTYLLWDLDAEQLQGTNQFGQTVTLQPFMGIMGMPPDEPGWHSTVPPRVTGGNIDCKELVPGSILYLPIAVPGGLFSVGDGHARQGNGEVSVTAIECPMDHVELTFELHSGKPLKTPRANTPAGWITIGLHSDLEQAALSALAAMIELLGDEFGLARHHALGLASVVVDLNITQMVNGTRGVHALLPHAAVTELGLEQRHSDDSPRQ